MPDGRAGAARRLSFRSNALGRDWRYIVYTPAGYATSKLSYPVLYLLHGNYGSPDDFIDAGSLAWTADRLIAEGRIPPVIIAMPDGAQSWYVNHGDIAMEDAILGEFIPFIETTERAMGTRGARAIGGISMGGYGSLRYALKRPDLFTSVALMSPAVFHAMPPAGSSALAGEPFCVRDVNGRQAFSPEAWRQQCYPSLMDAYLAGELPVSFHIDSGAEDEFGIATEARTLYEALRTRGQRARFGLRDGRHDWATWTEALKSALPYALAGVASPTKTPSP